jgi:hypothetical protein
VRFLYAVNGPDAAKGLKVFGLRRMPVASFVNRFAAIDKFADKLVQRSDHLVSMSYCQRSARTKIILDIDDHQRLFILN